MTGAENLMNTVINSLSMIDRGFTVTLTVQPHNWDDNNKDYDEEEDEDDEPHVSKEVIDGIKDFARRCGDVKRIADADNVFELYRAIRSMGDNLDDLHRSDADEWPKAGDEVWYKTKYGNHERGKAKVVCHNTIQLDNNVPLERKDCKRVPFEVGDEVWFDLACEIRCGYVEKLNDINCLIRTKKGVVQMPYSHLFDSVDELLCYLKSTADE